MATIDFRLSVLDQAPITSETTGSEALRQSVSLAREADALGYDRFWVAEHHGALGLACASPEVLIGPIAAVTRRIRVGSGGVMLPHYSAFKVAENFSMLGGLFPGRIDVGIGRAAGTDPRTSRWLRRQRHAAPQDDFTDQLQELLALLRNQRVPALSSEGPIPLPGSPESAAPWLLGSSRQSALWAAELALPYMFADFINPHGAAIARAYREEFEPDEFHSHPVSGVAVQVICAKTASEAKRLSLSYLLRVAAMHMPEIGLQALQTPEVAATYIDSGKISSDPSVYGRRLIVGTPDSVLADLAHIAEDYQANEVMVLSTIHSHEARVESYRLLAEAAGLDHQA